MLSSNLLILLLFYCLYFTISVSMETIEIIPITSSFANETKELHKENLHWNEILKFYQYYDANVCKRSYPSLEILAYVTPWNSFGYQVAELISGKLSWLVPVWFQIRRSKNGGVIISGKHDIDSDWINRVKLKHQQCLHVTSICSDEILSSEEEYEDEDEILTQTCYENTPSQMLYIAPRVLLETSIDGYEEIQTIVDELVAMKDEYGFDGYTFEISSQVSIILHVMLALKQLNIKLVLVIPAIDEYSDDIVEAILKFGNIVDRIHVMTYDFVDTDDNGSPRKTFNAPYSWVQSSIQGLGRISSEIRLKSMMGLPMYGWLQNEAITGLSLIQLLQQYQEGTQISWDKVAKEHLYFVDGKVLSYPTSAFLKHRLELAAKVKIGGVALWEIGQMLPYLINVL